MGKPQSNTFAHLTDQELVGLYQHSHNQEVLATLFLRYKDLVYGTCIKYLGSPDIAQDATMLIYQELVEKVQHHKVEIFKSWLFILCKNFCLMQLRRQKRHPQMAEIADDLMQLEAEDHLTHSIEKENTLVLLETCIENLNSEQQQSVRLFYLENKCYNEITTITGNDWNRVRSLIQNARRNLKICMEQHG